MNCRTRSTTTESENRLKLKEENTVEYRWLHSKRGFFFGRSSGSAVVSCNSADVVVCTCTCEGPSLRSNILHAPSRSATAESTSPSEPFAKASERIAFAAAADSMPSSLSKIVYDEFKKETASLALPTCTCA